MDKQFLKELVDTFDSEYKILDRVYGELQLADNESEQLEVIKHAVSSLHSLMCFQHIINRIVSDELLKGS